jgi:membrane dipeptidase
MLAVSGGRGNCDVMPADHAPPPRLIIDSHLDLAWNALQWNRDITETLEQLNAREKAMTDRRSRERATVSLPELRKGGLAVVLGTILARAKREVMPTEGFNRINVDFATQDIASAQGQGQLAYYRLLERRHEIRFIRNVSELDAHWRQWQQTDPVGIILAMEGADPIVEPSHAQWWWDQGLRVVGLAHYGKSHYAVGTGDAGPLTEKGIVLLREFERLGMILDLTHSSDPSFFQALDVFSGPVLASHNNCRVLCPGDRQYSDEQIRRLIARDAVIGVVFDAWMLYPGWEVGKTSRDAVSLDAILNNIDHICQLAGNTRHVAIGTDLDGGFGNEQIPSGMETIADLQKLAPMLSSRGYSDQQIDAIFHGNWLRFFREHLPK